MEGTTGRAVGTAAAAAFVLSLAVGSPLSGQSLPELGDGEREALIELGGLLALFQARGDAAWPGYDLCERALVLYVPDRWSLLLNVGPAPSGTVPYPESWPSLPCARVALRPEPPEGLVGQLAFDHPVGEETAAAVPLLTFAPEGYESQALAHLPFLVHEAFHQYQRDVLPPVETPPEERYPLLNARNNARAALEMHLLADAVVALRDGRRERARSLALDFLAVRRDRMAGAPALVAPFEEAKERVEGTAKYVEVLTVGHLAEACRGRALPPESLRPVCPELSGLSATGYLVDDFRNRLNGGALEPEDVPRNRIYPVGAALALLLDAFEPGWKGRFAGDGAGLATLLARALPGRRTGERVRTAGRRYALSRIEAQTARLIDGYLEAYRTELADFRAQDGIRVEVVLEDRDLARSRSSRVRRWVMDGGETVFAREFVVFTLRRTGEPPAEIRVRESGVLESVPREGPREVVFYTPVLRRLTVDGTGLEGLPQGRTRFATLEAEGPNFSLLLEGGGILLREGDRLRVVQGG